MYYSITSITRPRITRIPRQLELNLTNFLSLDQTFTESYCSIWSQATRLKQATAPCDFPTDWRDVEIQVQLVEKGKSRRVSGQTTVA